MTSTRATLAFLVAFTLRSCTPAFASLSDTSPASQPIDWNPALLTGTPPIARRLTDLVQHFGIRRIRIAIIEGDATKYRFQPTPWSPGLDVLLSEEDMQCLIRYATTAALVGKEFAQDVQWNGIRSVTELFGCQIRWGIPAAGEPDPEPDEETP